MVSSVPRLIEGHSRGDHLAQGRLRWFNWAGFLLIATVARLLCRELALEEERLRLGNQVVKPEVRGRLCFGDNERRSPVKAVLAN